MTIRRARGIRAGDAIGALLIVTASLFVRVGALAQEATAPVPRIVIYPGDIIHDDMLTDVSIDQLHGMTSSIVESRAALVGKRAKRTLLPGRAILEGAIENPRAVLNGAQVKLVFNEGGLTIITSAAALQDGGVGDIIKVRNTDSGLTISGTIQPDGSVLVSDG
jgi:flagella basal body P-ring formation protein FlgA